MSDYELIIIRYWCMKSIGEQPTQQSDVSASLPPPPSLFWSNLCNLAGRRSHLVDPLLPHFNILLFCVFNLIVTINHEEVLCWEGVDILILIKQFCQHKNNFFLYWYSFETLLWKDQLLC